MATFIIKLKLRQKGEQDLIVLVKPPDDHLDGVAGLGDEITLDGID
jgi:hypothetical protein